ncbi:MAG: ribonuclease [Chitinophagales bacterium]|nr:ribonuclease [Chitinophagales bacterium]
MNLKSYSKILLAIFLFWTLWGINGCQEYDNNNATLLETASLTQESSAENTTIDLSIADLSDEQFVIDYLKEHHQLPDYYITKREAIEAGWQASKGNLCEVLPGRVIGGDRFGNREKKLPQKQGRKYFEADINYNCGRRNAERIIFSNDQLIYVTKDHYTTFQKR